MTNRYPLPAVQVRTRIPSQTVAPQALAWHDGALWIGSRDLRLIYIMNPRTGTLLETIEPPGTPWAAVSTGEDLSFTIGEGLEDDRYLWRFRSGTGFTGKIPCPDLTGSYLSFDGADLYLSQWYNQRILQLDRAGGIVREFPIGAEVSGHVFADGWIYVLRGTERDGEDWRLARFNLKEGTAGLEDLARVPFACRSLAFDGKHFWANHREANETICFDVPS